jgi:hypothetical protein
MSTLAPVHEEALARAIRALEDASFAARLADIAGQPVNKVLGVLPRRVTARVSGAVDVAVRRGLDTALRGMDLGQRRRPRTRLSTALAGVSGAAGGFFGAAALPIELPVTTLLMLRAIAEIARHQGEDLTRLEPRLACLHVFALGSRGSDARADLGYFASRALVGQLSADAAALVVERGVVGTAGVATTGLVTEIVSRYSVTVADKMAVSAAPVLGALGGAAVNAIFMDHYQRVARGHFTVRRLERRYGPDAIRRAWNELSSRPLLEHRAAPATG